MSANPNTCLDLTQAIARLGHEGTCFGSTETLSRAMTSSPPDIVLVDDGSAAETADFVATLHERTGAVPLRVLGLPIDAAEIPDRVGYWGHILLPAVDDDLKEAIATALQQRAAASMEGGGEVGAVFARQALIELRLRLSLRARSLFVAYLSHELRTPLASILASADSLLMGLLGCLKQPQESQVALIHRNGEHLLSLCDDLLDWERVGCHGPDLNVQPLECAPVLAEIQGLMAPLAANKGLRLLSRLPPSPVVARADRRALTQVMLNLVGNAIKFTDSGSVSIGCRRSADSSGKLAVFEVKDTGPGIRDQDRQRIFEPFYRSEAVRRRIAGSGIGLHLSQRLARLMGGEIRLCSSSSAGSTFTLSLPLLDPSLPDSESLS